MVEFTFDKQMPFGYVRAYHKEGSPLIRYERENPTENYVVVPPAFAIHASDGTVFTLGPKYTQHNGEYEFNVEINGFDSYLHAKRIEMKGRVIKIFGQYGWMTWSYFRRQFI